MHTKTVLITGCSSGFGRAAVRAFDQAGWQVAATLRDPSKWRPPAEPAGNLLVLPLDVQDAESISTAVAQTIARFGTLDCLVNNAGQGLFSVFEATPPATWRALFETNVFGPMQLIQASLPHFRQAGGGRVVNVSSGSGLVAEPLMAAYAASKHAMEGFTEAAAYELATQGVIVKLVEPGFVASTNFVAQTQQSSRAVPVPAAYQDFVAQTLAMYMDMGGTPVALATEEEVARVILEAASDDVDRLRYPVGGDTLAGARMRWETSEKEYHAWTQAKYAARERGSR